MKKYLIIVNINGLQNVGICVANDSKEARYTFLKEQKYSEDSIRFIKAYELDNLDHNWSYYL